MGKLQKMAEKWHGLTNMLVIMVNHCPFNNWGIKWNRIQCYGLLQRCKGKVKGHGNKIQIGKNSRLVRCNIYINGDNNQICIGDSCLLVDTEFYIEDHGGQITIGNGTVIAGETQLAVIEGCSISIGKDCLLSSEIKVRTGDSHAICNLEGERINPSKDIIVNDRVWIGNRVVLLKGVTIPKDSVVGTFSVVTKAFDEPNCIYAGNPARKIKHSITWKNSR